MALHWILLQVLAITISINLDQGGARWIIDYSRTSSV
jgi:hypothetical protein